jgi:hypothetical protein
MAVVESVVRPERVLNGSESEILRSALDYHRATLLWKCEGLDDAQLRLRSVPASSLTLLDLLRHMAGAERHWFQRVLGQTVVEPQYRWRDNWYASDDPTPAEDVVGDFLLACEESRVIAAAQTFDETLFDNEEFGPASFRFIAVHMIEEYARHCGHADLIRESIDGAVGE